MKKTFLAVILLVSMTLSIVGCSRPAAKESANESFKKGSTSETTEVTTETTTEATTETTAESTTESNAESDASITYKPYKLKGIQFNVPENWRSEGGADQVIFYPIGYSDTALAVSYNGTFESAKYSNNAAFKTLVESLPETEGTEVTIINKSTESNDDFFKGRVEYTVTEQGKIMKKILQLTCDLKAGDSYVFYFVTPDATSEAYTPVFNEAANSVCVAEGA